MKVVSPYELDACARLRHRHFVLERKWVAENPARPGLETDEFDAHSLHLATFQGEEILAYMRVLPYQSQIGFMLDSDFVGLLGQCELENLTREGAVELSRLVCDSKFQHSRNTEWNHPVELMLKRLYQESKMRGFSRFYIVVEEAWLRPFSRRFGLPFRVIGRPHTFPDGTRTVAAVATLDELEEGMKKHSTPKYDWYQRQE